MVKAIARAFRWRKMPKRHARDHREVLRGPHATADAAGTRHCRGNPWWTAAQGDDEVDAAVPVEWGKQRAHIFKKGTEREKTQTAASNARVDLMAAASSLLSLARQPRRNESSVRKAEIIEFPPRYKSLAFSMPRSFEHGQCK